MRICDRCEGKEDVTFAPKLTNAENMDRYKGKVDVEDMELCKPCRVALVEKIGFWLDEFGYANRPKS